MDLGEIMFSLCYLPTAGRLTLTVIKCRNLKAMDITGYSGTSPTQVLAMWPPHSPDFRMWRDVEREGGGIAGILRLEHRPAGIWPGFEYQFCHFLAV